MKYRRETVNYPSQPEMGFSKGAALQEAKSYVRYIKESFGSRDQFLDSKRRISMECRTGRH